MGKKKGSVPIFTIFKRGRYPLILYTLIMQTTLQHILQAQSQLGGKRGKRGRYPFRSGTGTKPGLLRSGAMDVVTFAN